MDANTLLASPPSRSVLFLNSTANINTTYARKPTYHQRAEYSSAEDGKTEIEINCGILLGGAKWKNLQSW